MRAIAVLLLAALCLAPAGCSAHRGTGLIYTHTVTPLDLDLDDTPVMGAAGEGDIKQIQYSVVDVRWDSNAIGDIARSRGLETVLYADMEVLSILGIFTQRTVHVYGL